MSAPSRTSAWTNPWMGSRKETLTSADTIPEAEWVLSAGAFDDPLLPQQLTIGFEQGVPVALNGEALSPVELIEKLEVLAGGENDPCGCKGDEIRRSPLPEKGNDDKDEDDSDRGDVPRIREGDE